MIYHLHLFEIASAISAHKIFSRMIYHLHLFEIASAISVHKIFFRMIYYPYLFQSIDFENKIKDSFSANFHFFSAHCTFFLSFQKAFRESKSHLYIISCTHFFVVFCQIPPVSCHHTFISPFITQNICQKIMTDTCGFFIFLGLAKMFLPLLLAK